MFYIVKDMDKMPQMAIPYYSKGEGVVSYPNKMAKNENNAVPFLFGICNSLISIHYHPTTVDLPKSKSLLD